MLNRTEYHISEKIPDNTLQAAGGFVLRANHPPLPACKVQPQPGDLLVDRSRRAYAIWKDGSRRRLNPQQTTEVLGALQSRLSITAAAEPATAEPESMVPESDGPGKGSV